ncbi:MAG: hypothetical protein KBT00_06410 [Bacteroidales bacterium]|nr:hypothetical protein [Candidatus Cacconaster merdequi]
MKKLFTICILPIIILVLVFLVYSSIMKPVRFDKEADARKAVAVERLKDIRTIQGVYKSANGHYAPVMDSLVDFYNNGNINIVMQIGSLDDSAAVAHTEAVKKANRGITPDKLYQLYLAGDKNLVIQIPLPMAVKDTLFNGRPNFNINDLRYIPFSDGDTVIMSTVVKQVSGVDVPLFEAKMPFWSLLKGMDHQLIVNLVAEKEDTDRYAGWMVGSVDNPNNNAGNWE